MFKFYLVRVLIFLIGCASSFAQREPVLKQIDLPHSYYYREMYLPQLTTGPSAAAWSPDSKSLVYSMAGSLWRQEVGSTTAEQLTAGPGYDYQPDVSKDGRWVVFDRYDRDAVELWALDLRDGATHQLTSGGAVNLNPGKPGWNLTSNAFRGEQSQGVWTVTIYDAVPDGVTGKIADLTLKVHGSAPVT